MQNHKNGSNHRIGHALIILPIPLLIILAISLQLLGLGNSVTFDPPGLLPLLNLLFLFICPMFVWYLATKSYMKTGTASIITMGSGVFTLALGSLIAGFLLSAKGPNAVITIHNISACLAGLFHLIGSVFVFIGFQPEQDVRKRKYLFTLMYSSIFVLLTVFTLAVYKNTFPDFFIQGQGPTILRQIILGIAVFSFSASGLLIIILNNKPRSLFLFWYATALILISIGLGCVFIQKSFGGPIGWLGRIAQYIGCLYLVASILSGSRETGERFTRFDIILSSFFRNRFEKLLTERTAELEKEITERKKTEKKLVRNEALLNNTQHIAHIGGWEWDIKKQTMYWTDETYHIHDIEPGKSVLGTPEHIDHSIECYLPDDQPVILAAFQQCVETGQPYDLEFHFITSKRRELWVRTFAEPILENDKVIRVQGSIMDITKSKLAEEKIKASLKEKETLLQEIHHRVKNNMTVISSLLGLQANSLNDEQLKAALKDSQNRVQSMSVIHEVLYQSDNLSSIDMNTYLSNLSGAIARNYTISSKVNVRVESENILIGAKQASPLGLVVNELITNSFKYAFPENQEGEIIISLVKTAQDQILLEYTDNGIGMPKGFDWHKAKSMGLKLVKTLTENQLDGSIDMESNNGTKFTIKFNIET